MMRLVLGGAIAVILLGFYAWAVFKAIRLARDPDGGTLGDGFVLVMQSVGGLISALVVAALALTKTSEATVMSVLAIDEEASASIGEGARDIIAGAYLTTWVVAGGAAFVFGTLLYPRKVQPLSDLGQAWLGTAVVAAYAFFGLHPPA
jgi:hypothetical protein